MARYSRSPEIRKNITKIQALMSVCLSRTPTKPISIFRYPELATQCKSWAILLLIYYCLEDTLWMWEVTIISLYIFHWMIYGAFPCTLTSGFKSSHKQKELRTFYLSLRIPSRNQMQEKGRPWQCKQMTAASYFTVDSISIPLSLRSGNTTCILTSGLKLTSLITPMATPSHTWKLQGCTKAILWFVHRVGSLWAMEGLLGSRVIWPIQTLKKSERFCTKQLVLQY